MKLNNLIQISVLLFLLFTTKSFAQTTKFQLHIDFGKTVEQIGNVLNTADGGYLVCGTMQDINGKYPFLVKVANYGQVVWKVIYETSPVASTGKFVIQTADGGYMMVGEISTSVLNKDILVIRTDSLGNQIWNKTYGNNAIDMGNNIVPLLSGNFLIFGESEMGLKKGIIIRINENGDVLETNYLDIVFAHEIRGKLIGTNQIIVTGTGVTEIFTDTSGIYQGQSNLQLSDSVNTTDVVIASSGNHITIANKYGASFTGYPFYLTTDSVGGSGPAWINTYGSSNLSIQTPSLILTPNGNFIVAGSLSPIFGFGSLFLTEIDTTGNSLWFMTYGPNNSPDFRVGGALATSDGGYLLTGSGYVGPGKYDLYIIKTDSVGVSGCSEMGTLFLLQGTGNYTNPIQLSGNPGPLQINGIPGLILDTSFGSENVLCYTAIENDHLSFTPKVTLHPNPFFNYLKFESDEQPIGIYELFIYDMMGVMKINLFSNNGEWSGTELELLPKGLYIAIVKTKGVSRIRTKLIR